MTTFMEPTTIDIPVEITEPENDCTAGLDWCEGCDKDDPHHFGAYGNLPVTRLIGRDFVVDYLPLLLSHDESSDQVPLALLDDQPIGFTAEQARASAAWLLNVADVLDPLPVGVMVTTAVQVRIGDELLTDDGWQKVTGLLYDTATEQASVFTPERPMDDSDGWDLSFHDPVKVRRPLHGSCALQFVQPIPASTTGGTK